MSIGVFDLVAILALLSASTLCIVAVTAILRLMKNVDRITYSVESVQHDVRAMRTAAKPSAAALSRMLWASPATVRNRDRRNARPAPRRGSNLTAAA